MCQDTIYFKLNGTPSSKLDSPAYYSLKQEINLLYNNNYGIIKYYMNDSIYDKGEYSDPEGIRHNGKYECYYENGSLKSDGLYSNGNKDGFWKNYYENGQLKEFLEFEIDNELLYPKKTILTYLNNSGDTLVVHGSGYYEEFNTNNGSMASGKVKKGNKEGEWVCYRPNGELYYKEFYNNGKLTEGTSYDLYGKSYKYSKIESAAEPKKGVQEFYNFIAKNIRYPHVARKNRIQGIVYVQFIVDENGELTNIEVVKGFDSACDNEAKYTLSLCKSWLPAKQRGQNVKQRIILPITFKLGS